MLKVPAGNFAPICKISYVEVEDMTGDPPIDVMQVAALEGLHVVVLNVPETRV